MIYTNRCTLSKIALNDMNDVKSLYNNVEVRKYLGGIIDDESFTNKYNKMYKSKQGIYWVIRLSSNSSFLGLISLTRYHDGINTEISYQLLPTWWGLGLASEVMQSVLQYAFNTLNLSRVYAETQTENNGSCKLLLRNEFTLKEKILRFNEEQSVFLRINRRLKMSNINILSIINNEIENMDSKNKSTQLTKIANKNYRNAPKDDMEFIELCKNLIASNNMSKFSIATIWLSKRKSVIDIKYFNIFENWLIEYVDDWWKCDQYCCRVLNPLILEYPELYANVLNWIKSDKIYVKRAAPVSLITTGRGMSVNYDIDKILHIVDLLKHEKHHHLQKGIGWLLKFSYLTYPKEVIKYLKSNLHSLSRTTYRYALQKMPNNIKQHMMKL